METKGQRTTERRGRSSGRTHSMNRTVNRTVEPQARQTDTNDTWRRGMMSRKESEGKKTTGTVRKGKERERTGEERKGTT